MTALTKNEIFSRSARMPTVTLTARGGVRSLIRVAQRFLGITFSVAGLALLLLPFGAETTAEILLKLMFALVLGFAGAGLWQAGGRVAAPELEIDVIRREVRLVRGFGPARTVVTRRPFNELGGATVTERSVSFWDSDRELLAEVTIADKAALGGLRRALKEEGVAI